MGSSKSIRPDKLIVAAGQSNPRYGSMKAAVQSALTNLDVKLAERGLSPDQVEVHSVQHAVDVVVPVAPITYEDPAGGGEVTVESTGGIYTVLIVAEDCSD